MHIAIAGNIGSGKTTLTKLLSKHYNWDAHYEKVDDNPYLNDFYNDMQRWSFNLQIYFLKSRFTQIMNIRESGRDIIQDRTIFEDALIFAPNLFEMGLMTERDFKNYQNLFELMSSMIEVPDLIIYLRAKVPTLVKQIKERGREYEETIRIDYLKNLNDRYNLWADNYESGKLLIVDVDETDFINSPTDMQFVIDKIEAKLNGLF